MLWWRKVRNHSYWLAGADPHPEGSSYYVHDVALRPQEAGLSLFAIADMAEVDKVNHYFGLTLAGYNHVDCLLIPDGVWHAIGLQPQQVIFPTIHPYLSDLHFEVRGLNETIESKLAKMILADKNRHACRTKKGAIQTAASTYLANEPTLRQFLHEDWMTKLHLA